MSSPFSGSRRSVGNEDPLGRTIRLQRLAAMPPAPVADPTFEIVGVVRDTANLGPRDLPGTQASTGRRHWSSHLHWAT